MSILRTNIIEGLGDPDVVQIPTGVSGQYVQELFDGSYNIVAIKPKDLITKGPWVDARAYGTLGTQAAITAALADIGTDSRTLYLASGTWSITSSLGILANVNVRMEKGAVLAIATAQTLTINGSLEAGLYQIFSCTGTGKVAGIPKVPYLYPQWWGSDTTAMQAALTLGSASKIPVKLVNFGTDYSVTGLTIDDDTSFIGEGQPTLLLTGTGSVLANSDQVGGNSNITVKGITCDSNQVNTENVPTIYFKTVTGLICEKVKAENQHNTTRTLGAFQVWLCNEALLIDCEANTNDGEGLWVHNCLRPQIRGGSFVSNQNSGLVVELGREATVIGTLCRSNGTNTSSSLNINSPSCTVIGNRVYDAKQNGINIGHPAPAVADDTVVIGNTVIDSASTAIMVASSDRVMVIGNTVDNPVVVGTGVAIAFSTGTCTDGVVSGNTIRRQYAGIYASGANHKVVNNVIETTVNYSITGHDMANGIIENNSCLNSCVSEANTAILLTASAGTLTGCRVDKNIITDGGVMTVPVSVAANYTNTSGDTLSINDVVYDVEATTGKKVIITLGFSYGYPYMVEVDFIMTVGGSTTEYFHNREVISGCMTNATTLAADSAITLLVAAGHAGAITEWTGAQAATGADFKLAITYTNGGADTFTGKMRLKALSTYGILSVTVENNHS